MITLHVLKALELAGFGTIDADLFWEDVPIGADGNAKDGVWVVTRGAPVSRFGATTQSFDVYSRYADKILGSQKLEQILEYLQRAYDEVCELPQVLPYSKNKYTNVRITPTSGIENVGTDENNKIVRVISGQVQCERST